MDRHPDRTAALASLRARWGAAAPRPAVEVFGALAAAPQPAEAGAAAVPRDVSPARPALVPLPGGAAPGPAARARPGEPARDPDRAIPTGFAELDGLLADGGLPRAGTVVLRGAGSSGATTLALRTLAEAQAGGALAAWVDLGRSLDPVEAVARGVRLEWLAVLVPGSTEEALAMAGTLLQARAVDVLVLDLAVAGGRPARGGAPARDHARAVGTGRPAGGGTPERSSARPGGSGAGEGSRRPHLAGQLARLVALGRRSGALLLVLEPADPPGSLRAALGEGASLRLELRRRGWIRLGREVVGQRTEVLVAKDRHGAPDRRTAIRLLYAEGGPRDRCLARDDLLVEAVAGRSPAPGLVVSPGSAVAWGPAIPPEHPGSTDAPPPPRLAPSRPPARPTARSIDPRRGADRPRRAAVG